MGQKQMKLQPQGANQTELTLPDGTLILFSYRTPVACWQAGAFYRTETNHSRTTEKHITQFRRRQGCLGWNMRPQAFFDSLVNGRT